MVAIHEIALGHHRSLSKRFPFCIYYTLSEGMKAIARWIDTPASTDEARHAASFQLAGVQLRRGEWEMAAKLLLPTLGGSPSVWNASMVFFQTALLAGYGYAHLLQRLAAMRAQVGVHLGLLIVAAFFLPLQISGLLGDPDPSQPAMWLLATLAVSIGAPFSDVRKPPSESKFSRANPIGSTILWQPVHIASVACALRRSREVLYSGLVVSWTTVKFTLPGGSGTFWQRICSRSARPRIVGEVRPGWA